MELTRKSSDGALHFTFRSGGVAENEEMRREILLCMSFKEMMNDLEFFLRCKDEVHFIITS